MRWEFRMIKNEHNEIQIHEVYYDDSGKISAWGEPSAPVGATPEGVGQDLSLMLKALEKPVLKVEHRHVGEVLVVCS